MKREYSNGYYPKIKYWTSELQKAIDNNNLSALQRCSRKLDYFIQRQNEVALKNWGPKVALLPNFYVKTSVKEK